MKFSISLLAASLATADGSAWGNLRRHLSYEKVATYSPGSQVTDHCAIDRDQRALEIELARKTNESWQNAQQIYLQGGNSKSYALITLSEPLRSDVPKGTKVFGTNAAGNEVAGKMYSTTTSGSVTVKIQYATTDLQDSYVQCQVGALVGDDVNLSGCFAGESTITIGEEVYPYTYTPETDNNNGRTISGFSTQLEDKLKNGPGAPYADFEYFRKYYGTSDYADQWVNAAFEGGRTSFTNGNADFSQYSMEGREQIIKKGTAYMNVFMYVIREFEDALDDCKRGCINCNDDPVHAWDEGVCFYAGSLEGQDGTPSGYLLHQLADKRSENYRTGGPDGTDIDGQSKVNYDLMDKFSLGNYQLQAGNCPSARKTKEQIAQLMYIPMIQGSLRYAYKVDKLQGGEKEAAEGAAFAAAVLPRIHAASPEAATKIYNSLRVGATNTNAAEVKAAFESVYPQLGLTCADIGGLWNEAAKTYYPGMDPCVDASTNQVVTKTNSTLAIALGTSFGVLFAVALIAILYMRSREKQGSPVFKTEGEEANFN
mmetsp:Transcript_21404/g.33590  ORF Transcript_21404/g.33590 Transcript_21404/m.33590 type:complete len:541 (+) Transcript_21404:54-1676(+)